MARVSLMAGIGTPTLTAEEKWLSRMKTNSHRLPETKCPNCGTHLDAATEVGSDDGKRPSPGDLTVCIECSVPLVFKADLSMRLLDVGDFDALSLEDKRVLLTSIVAVKMTNIQRERKKANDARH
jgi:hypothetical protein